MIYQNQYWYELIPSSGKGRDEITGKWLYFDETSKLHSLLEDLNALVEAGEIRGAKVARKLPNVDPFPEKQCVLCVFTSNDQEEKDRVKNLLKAKLNISVEAWKSDEQTRRDWEAGGWLQIQAEITKLRRHMETGEAADVQAAQKRVLELTQQLERLMKGIDDPNQKTEIDLNRIHEVRRATQASLATEVLLPEFITRIKSLEEAMAAILSKVNSGEIGREMTPTAHSPNSVFIIMPFSDEHTDTYRTIKRAAKEANPVLEVMRVDEKPGAFAITDEIHRSIQDSRLVICDLSDERPNVYYELGFARGLNKPLICLAREGTKLHFDVYGLKTIFFKAFWELEEKLGNEIKKMCPSDEDRA